jgi:hypothetical protein
MASRVHYVGESFKSADGVTITVIKCDPQNDTFTLKRSDTDEMMEMSADELDAGMDAIAAALQSGGGGSGAAIAIGAVVLIGAAIVFNRKRS